MPSQAHPAFKARVLVYWARVHFHREPSGKVTGFAYHLIQDFPARKID